MMTRRAEIKRPTNLVLVRTMNPEVSWAAQTLTSVARVQSKLDDLYAQDSVMRAITLMCSALSFPAAVRCNLF